MSTGTGTGSYSEDEDLIPADIRSRIIMHGQQTPMHRRLQDRLRKEEGMEYADIRTWDDLRTVFDYMDDDDLLELDTDEMTPDHYDDDELVFSRSSGTTGAPKELYWHEDDVQDNVDYLEETLRDAGIPEEEYWLATATPNPVLQETLGELADRFDATGYDLIEVDPRPIKRALKSGDEEAIQDAFADAAEDVIGVFEDEDVGVYEDIAPMMEYISQAVDPEVLGDVDAALIGGVGTDEETVGRLDGEVFEDGVLTGWYGDYMNGFSTMTEAATLDYLPDSPAVRLEVRDFEDRDQVVDEDERGEVISHTIRRGFFIPNRRIGDQATRITHGDEQGVSDVGRLE